MSETALYESIFVRKSVRRYKPQPLEAPVLEEVRRRLDHVEPLLPGVRVTLELLGADQIAGAMAVKAPHFLAAYATNDVRSLMAVGYALQQMELWLVSAGLGCCYSGMAKTSKPLRERDGLDCQLLLGFGMPDEPPRRESVSEFKRKPLEEICTPDTPRDLMEAVRLAPSGVNRQNWYFAGEGGSIQVFRGGKGGLVGLFAKSMGYMDMGIALCHLTLAARRQGLGCRFDFTAAPAQVPKGMRWLCAARLDAAPPE